MYLGYLQDSFRQDKELFRNNNRWEWYKSELRILRLNITKQRVKKSVYAHIPKPFTVAEHTSQLKEIAVGLPIYMGLVSIALCGDPAKFKQLSLLTDEELKHRRCVYW